MKKPIAILALVGVLALVGTAAVLAANDAATDPSGSAALTAEEGATPRSTLLSGVLDDLVADGTITQAQADTIVSTLQARHDERRAAREAAREQMRTFLEDGVISADELAQLPEDHPLRSLGSILDDGRITQDELRSLRGPGGFGHRGHGFGGGPFGQWDAPKTDDGASTSTDVSSS